MRERQEVREGFALQGAEGGLALGLKERRDGEGGAALDLLVQIDEGPAKRAGQATTEGRLAAAWWARQEERARG
jgi:hypothetical protein